MKSEQFTQALGDVEDKYIDEAVNYKMNDDGKIKKSLKIWRIVAIAACVCLAAGLVWNIASITASNLYYDASDSASGAQYSKVVSNSYYETETRAARATSNDISLNMMAEDTAYMYEEAVEESAVYDGAGGAVAGTFAAVNGAEEAVADESDDTVDPAKIIYNVDVTIQTTAFDEARAALESLINGSGAYIQNQYQSNPDTYNSYSYNYRNASYTIRVPVEQLDSFVSALESEGSGTVTYISKYADDVSEQYYDIQGRLETARTKLERLQELLAEAEDMSDIITIENSITDVEYQIESYSGSLRYYDSQVSYSTVTVYLNEVYEIEEPEAPMTFGERISNAFSNGIKSIGDFAKNFVIWLAASWIWIVIIAVVLAAVIVIIKKNRNKKKK